jgi:CII-binding regulator of phage lambda lysogenization HflD
MELAIEELTRTLNYHTRQQEELKQKIQRNKESIVLLEESVEKEQQYIDQISKAIKALED